MQPVETDLREFEKLFLALGDKTRLRLLGLMADGPVAVGYLTEKLQESQPKVSRHLAYMRNAGIVDTRRDGKWIYYEIRYSQNASLRKILQTAVSSMSISGIEVTPGELMEVSGDKPAAGRRKSNRYAKPYAMPNISELTYMSGMSALSENSESHSSANDIETFDHSEQEEMDVFLL
jgi:DNA-binding transcriptional ArsR family regulator